MTKLGIRTLVVITALALGGPAWAGGNFRAHLNGASQVPPADSQGRGQFIGKLHHGALRYRLVVANIENVVAAHIHCGEAGMNGPVGVTLFVGGPVSTSGPLARGPILAPDTNNGCGWADVDDIIDALESGDTYINVHTLQNLPGEIRGQVNPPGNEGVCDGLRGGTPGLHGLCVAFCEAQDCNATYDEATGEMTLDPNCKPSADGLLDAYIERSTAGDPLMPCVIVVADPCPCWTEDEIDELGLEEGECTAVGDLTRLEGLSENGGSESAVSNVFSAPVCLYTTSGPAIFRFLNISIDEFITCRDSIVDECDSRGFPIKPPDGLPY